MVGNFIFTADTKFEREEIWLELWGVELKIGVIWQIIGLHEYLVVGQICIFGCEIGAC